MALPRSIQLQVEQAEATLAAYAAPEQSEVAQPAAPEPKEEVAPVSSEAPAVEQPVAPQPVVSEDTWAHKFRSLQGIFQKEVPALQGQVKDLTRRLDQALSALEAAKNSKPQEPAQHTVDPKDVENFGADLVDMVNRIAERRFSSVAQQVDAKFGELQKVLGTVESRLEGTNQTVAVTAEQAFFDKLAVAVPEWEQINAAPAFLAWLAESDPVYGVPRQEALNAAREQLDLGRIVSVFRAFAPKPTTPAPVVRNPVDRQVSPKAGASAQAPVAATPVTFTQKQISDFYNDVARGKFRGREDEAKAIEQSVNSAIAEGRVR